MVKSENAIRLSMYHAPATADNRAMRSPLRFFESAGFDCSVRVLLPRLVRDSGRVFRERSIGVSSTRVNTNDINCPMLCVSAGADRNVAQWTSRRIAARYGGEHQVHPGLPH